MTQAQAILSALEKLGGSGTAVKILPEVNLLGVAINKDHLSSKLASMKRAGKLVDLGIEDGDGWARVVYALPTRG